MVVTIWRNRTSLCIISDTGKRKTSYKFGTDTINRETGKKKKKTDTGRIMCLPVIQEQERQKRDITKLGSDTGKWNTSRTKSVVIPESEIQAV